MSEQPADEEASVPITIGEALDEYLGTLSPEVHNTTSSFVKRYVDYAGRETAVAAITGARVESYALENIQISDPHQADRVVALKAWFQFLKKRGYAEKNYGVHVRLRRAAGRASAAQTVNDETIEMTSEGIDGLREELALLEARVPELVKAISIAREDKDFRENAPLEAAREALSFNEGRRRDINDILRRAVAVDAGGDGDSEDDRSTIGSTVQVVRLDNSHDIEYKLVSAREANAAARRISVESPVGKELLGRRPGDEVTVSVPAGVIQFRVTAVSKS